MYLLGTLTSSSVPIIHSKLMVQKNEGYMYQ